MQNSTYLGLVSFPRGDYSAMTGPTKDRYTDKRLCFCSPVSRSSLLIASGTLLATGGEPSRMPALTYKVSAEISSARAICCKMSADGRRMPRSICERYGFDTVHEQFAARCRPMVDGCHVLFVRGTDSTLRQIAQGRGCSFVRSHVVDE